LPEISSYDPFHPAVMADPYPYYRWLREHAPCYRNTQRDIYVLSRYDDVLWALRNPTAFSSDQGVGYERRPVPMMIAYDPPEHLRLRRIVSSRFTKRQVARWADRIQTIVDRLLDGILEAGRVDLVDSLSGPSPVQVIADMMGIPMERRADFKRWSDSTVEALGGAVDLSAEERERVEFTIFEFAMYFQGVIKERRAKGDANAEDLISLLIQANEDGERLTDPELVSFCVLLLVAGNETTTNLISNTALNLMKHPEQWSKLRANPGMIESFVEESLRFDSPIQGFFRNTKQAIELHGVTIPENAKVMVSYASANRDGDHFPEPDQYRIDRNPDDHLAFGKGNHSCLGAQLARLEARILARSCLERIAGMTLCGEPERTANPLLRGLARLPVEVKAR